MTMPIEITMTPALRAALIKLRDASVALRAASEAHTNYNTRSKEGKAQLRAASDAVDVRSAALDSLLAVIDPGFDEDMGR
jgi:hypothetical protein